MLSFGAEPTPADSGQPDLPAVLADDTYDVRQNDEARTLPVLGNDQFPDGYSRDQFLSAVSYGSQGGTVEIAEDGLGVIYSPPADFVGTETFTYFVGDQFATVTVAVQAVVSDDTYSAYGGGRSLVLGVLDNDPFWRQYEGRRVITGVSETTFGGTVEVAADGRSVTYTPPEAAEDGDVDAFVYVVDDRYPAQVSIELSSPLQDDEYSTLLVDSTNVLDVLRNDRRTGSGLPLKRITHVFVSELRGTATIADDGQSIVYTPAPGFHGYDSFRYVVDHLHEAEVVVWVHRPVADDWFSTHAGTPRVVDVLENDVFDDPLGDGDADPIDVVDRVTSVGATAKGGRAAIVDSGRAIEYTPPAGFWGEDTFEYVADHAYTARVSVTVPRPVVDDWFPLDANSADARLDVGANDISQYWDWDEESGNYSTADVVQRVSSVGEPDRGGLLTVSEDGQAITYTPPRGFVGTDSFSYVADGAFEARVTVNVTNPVRDDWFEVRRDAAATLFAVLANDFYGNGYSGARLVTSVDATDTVGHVEAAPDGAGIYYTPQPGFVGSDRFAYTVDGSLVATVYVSVTPRAILSPDWVGVCAGESDVSLDVLQNDPRLEGRPGETIITGVSEPGPGASVRVARDGRSLVFSSHGLSSPSYPLTYTVFGEFTASVTVRIEQSHYAYARWDTALIDQNSTRQSIDVLANDWFDDHPRCGAYPGPREVTRVSASQHGGSVSIADDRKTVLYSPASDFVGGDSFTYQVDGGPEATVSVTVIRRVRDDRYHVATDSRANVLPVLVNDLFGANYAGAGEVSDVTQTSAGGIATIADDHRAIVYTPPRDFVGRDTFTYTVDGRLKAEVSVTVGGGLGDILPRFESDSEFVELLAQRADAYGYRFGAEWSYYQYTGYGGPEPITTHRGDLGGRGDLVYTSLESFSLPLAAGDKDADRVHSETNVQIAGVDEADIIENDGDFLYVISRGELLIARAWPADALSLVSRLALEGSPVGAYLHGERLTVVSRTWGDEATHPQQAAGANYASAWASPWRWWGTPRTLVTVLDVSDRSAPKVVKKTSVEGDYVESRRIGDYVYLVLRSDISVPYPKQICETETLPEPSQNADDPVGRNDYDRGYYPSSITRCKYETRDEYIERITADPTESLPGYTTRDAGGELLASGVAVPPDHIFRPDGSNQTRLISVVSVNMSSDEPDLADSSAVMTSSASKIFGSLENLYVFDQSYSQEDGATTEILQFDWDASTGGVELRAAGSAAGTMLNQFSADEYAGYLRIATTISNSGSGNWSDRSENALFVLRADAGVLEFVGSLQNLGVSESIRSVRFLGERAFITTFRDVDPLFALDLSDPTAPRTAGHVTLPGYNSYMQFIDDYHILAVGRNAAAGTVGTTQIALFDVTELARPRLVDRDVLPRYTESIAEADHHAFGWFAHHQMLGLPTSRSVTRRVDSNGDGYRESWATTREDELFLYRIDVTAAAPSELGIHLVGDLQHDSAVLRAAFIDQVLYSIAERSITAIPADNPTQRIAEIGLPADEPTQPTPGELLPVTAADQVLDQPHVIFGMVRDRRPTPAETGGQDPPTEQPQPVIGPRVTDVRTVARKRRITAIEVQFDKDLDPATAVDLAHFEARVARPARRNAASATLIVPVRFAAYDETSRTVTLTLARPLRIGRDIIVVVKENITDRDGHALADDGDSLPHTQVILSGRVDP